MLQDRPSAGFTIIELAAVLVILGILVVLGAPYFGEGQVGAQRNSCLDRQGVIYRGALLHCADNVVPDGTINVSSLHPKYLQSPGTDCPSEVDNSHDDYTITIVDGGPVDVTCDIKGDEHPWEPH